MTAHPPISRRRYLDTLRQHHAVATFFVMGQQVKQYPKLLQQEVAQGHVIGYHTYTHALHPTLSQAEREMEQTRQVVQQTIGRDTALFRPPYGNTRSNYTRSARDQNYALILWNVSSADTATRDADVVLDNCTANVHSGDIILMHDSSTKSHTARALPRILTRLGTAGLLLCHHPQPAPPVRRYTCPSLWQPNIPGEGFQAQEIDVRVCNWACHEPGKRRLWYNSVIHPKYERFLARSQPQIRGLVGLE